MYGHSHNNDTYTFSPDFLDMSPPVPSLLPQHARPPLIIPAYKLESTCSGGYDSPSYTARRTKEKEIHRSVSSNSIATQLYNNGFLKKHVSSPSEILDSEDSSSITMIRKVFSAGDLQGTNLVPGHLHQSESPLSSESNSIIESMNKVCRYSPDEKKERIERYRSKKTQRNFTKTIKYVCRKTLADSRPRIRGRFARNDEIQIMEHQCVSQGGGEEGNDDDNDESWMNSFLDSFPPILSP
ncbi:uncharacterized protein LOC143618660 [Bidens hawaiensis]|uniref:uncharacterized protein LOC143618660 n=1 Tax=Bidens hawaiensis TaxID=980011 RepID=UPI00404A8E3E